MLELLRRRELKRLARGLPPNPKRRFDAIKALDGDLAEASRAYAREAGDHGAEGDWWQVWRAIQHEMKRPLSEAVAELSAEQRRWLGVWLLRRGDLEEGIEVYGTFLSAPGGWGTFEAENVLYIDALVAKGRLADAVEALDRLEADPTDRPTEQCRVCIALLDAGQAEAALARMSRVLGRYHDDGRTWAVTALAHAAAGRELEARRAVLEAAKCGLFDEALIERVAAGIAPQWQELAKRHEYQPADIEAQQQAWNANPGADLVPRSEGAPHQFGGDEWRTPECRGCGHHVRVWFTLDLEAIPSFRGALPGWRFFPLLGCVDCMVWMGRHDYCVDPVNKAIELLNVAISTSRYGEAHDTTPVLPAQPADLRWRQAFPTSDMRDPPQAPQVGGLPSWTQDARRIYCPSCRKEMVFVASMASPEGFTPTVPINNESGFQYHFACAGCRRLSVIAQWT